MNWLESRSAGEVARVVERAVAKATPYLGSNIVWTLGRDELVSEAYVRLAELFAPAVARNACSECGAEVVRKKDARYCSARCSNTAKCRRARARKAGKTFVQSDPQPIARQGQGLLYPPGHEEQYAVQQLSMELVNFGKTAITGCAIPMEHDMMNEILYKEAHDE